MEFLGIFLLLFGLWFVPPLILFIVALIQRRKNSQQAKTLALLGVVYLIIGGGVCASLLA